jgi:hypothetical protein
MGLIQNIWQTLQKNVITTIQLSKLILPIHLRIHQREELRIGTSPNSGYREESRFLGLSDCNLHFHPTERG